jgi:hypothetical protein
MKEVTGERNLRNEELQNFSLYQALLKQGG